MDKPSVLFIYHTYTQQTLKMVETMTRALRDRSSDLFLVEIEFAGRLYA